MNNLAKMTGIARTGPRSHRFDRFFETVGAPPRGAIAFQDFCVVLITKVRVKSNSQRRTPNSVNIAGRRFATPDPRRRSRRGFTIIEMLGVLLLLAILITMLVSVVGIVQRKAQQCRAQTDANALVQAVLHYQQAYGTWPGAATNGAQDVCVAGNGTLINMLNTGNASGLNLASNTDLAAVITALTPNSPANPRQILFLTTPTNALINGLSDPWGKPYLLVMGAQQTIFQFNTLAWSNLPVFAISAGAPAANASFSNWIFSAGIKP